MRADLPGAVIHIQSVIAGAVGHSVGVAGSVGSVSKNGGAGDVVTSVADFAGNSVRRFLDGEHERIGAGLAGGRSFGAVHEDIIGGGRSDFHGKLSALAHTGEESADIIGTLADIKGKFSAGVALPLSAASLRRGESENHGVGYRRSAGVFNRALYCFISAGNGESVACFRQTAVGKSTAVRTAGHIKLQRFGHRPSRSWRRPHHHSIFGHIRPDTDSPKSVLLGKIKSYPGGSGQGARSGRIGLHRKLSRPSGKNIYLLARGESISQGR